ncbi:MAG: homogentisate phytyltransferase [Leptolyngbyaceae cyanobacterium SM1_1_3]|nr:homogentisate phytyltransferase [Leptolyngbyaceae cyanobacterium SM1_1_3]NJN03699.1 homogentisate phytyltransferase [Leptolyngbyaceae cyanobacterium RM1_1_2]NJO09328.1 homogentisate phytyltransferase [Leptolyngbyaceae cyanobacterium SL_1_1]
MTQLHFFKSPKVWLYALWKFSRPHTIVGTSLSVWGLFAIAWATVPALDLPSLWPVPVWAWLACLGGNVYIVGLNQLEDVAIDRINKPHLPLASGEFSRRQAVGIIAFCSTLAIAIALSQGPFLLATVGTSLLIGTAYSLPPIRLKRFPFWASFCILSVRGAIVNLGLYLHYSDRFGLQLAVPARVWALTLFVLIFSFAIAIFKDIPDIEGDRRYSITTFTVQLGQKTVFDLARWVLTLCYGGLIVTGPFLADVNGWFLSLTHLAAIALFWWLSFRVVWQNRTSGISYSAFYQFIWKLFFIEYLLFPLACWL